MWTHVRPSYIFVIWMRAHKSSASLTLLYILPQSLFEKLPHLFTQNETYATIFGLGSRRYLLLDCSWVVMPKVLYHLAVAELSFWMLRHDRDARFALSTFISKAISDDGYRRVARCFIVSLIAVATLRNYHCCRESILSQNYRVFVGRRHDPLFVSGQRPTLGSPGFIRLAYDHSSALIMSFSDKFSLGWNTSKHYDVLRLGQTDNALFRALQSDTY